MIGDDHSFVALVTMHQFERIIVHRNINYCISRLSIKSTSKSKLHSSSCPNPPEACGWNFFNSDAPNTNILYGALVGGPNLLDEYEDVRNDAVRNEVAIDYNAAFQGAIAAIQQISINNNVEGLHLNYQVTLWLGIAHVATKLLLCV